MADTDFLLPRSAPEAHGILSENVVAFLDGIESEGLELHSLMVVKNDHVVAEGWWLPYQQHDKHLLYSLSKSFMSTGIGFAVQEGLLGLDDKVISFFPDKLPGVVSENLAAMRIRDLLTMSCGHVADDMTEMYLREDQDWVKGFLAREVPFEPGTHFLYNSSASYVLSAILTQITRTSLLEFLKPRFLEPLGITEATWETCPKGISVGGWGMSIATESIAKFGLFYLHKGLWNGKQLLPAAWIEDATRFHISNAENKTPDWQQGYGYQFWRSTHHAYRGDGAFGQFCVVLPELNMIVATTAAAGNMQAILDLVWKHLVEPASHSPLESDDIAHGSLLARLQTLKLKLVTGATSSPTAERVTGNLYESVLPDHRLRQMSFEFAPGKAVVRFFTAEPENVLSVGIDCWIPSLVKFRTPEPQRVAARGSWIAPDTFEIIVRYLESPTGVIVTNQFSDSAAKMSSQITCTFGPPEGPCFEGRLKTGNE